MERIGDFNDLENETIFLYVEDIESTTQVNQESAESTETSTEESTESVNLEFLTTEGQNVDTNLYMSCEVSGASINDVYSITLSLRNICLVFFLFIVLLKFKGMTHNAINRSFKMNK